MFLTYIFCHYKPKYALTGIHSYFPQFVLIVLINYIKYTKIINTDNFLLFSLLGIWILFFILRKAIISVYIQPEMSLKLMEILLWTYLFALLIMMNLKKEFVDYNILFALDLINLMIIILIFISNETLTHHFKWILRKSLFLLYFKRNSLSRFYFRRISKRILRKKNALFDINHEKFLHKYKKNYLKSNGKNQTLKKTNYKETIGILIYFLKFKGKLHLQSKQLTLLFKFTQNNSLNDIALNKLTNIYNIQSLFDCRLKLSIKIDKINNFRGNQFLLFLFKNLSNLHIRNFSILLLTGKIFFLTFE